jgi:penicillin-binding protein 1A
MDGQDPAPLMVLAAFEAAEDRQFRDRVPMRSVLTQQIAQWFPDPAASATERAAAALMIGAALDHDEVLRWYATGIYLRQSCFGAQDAAVAYFGKTLSEVTLPEAAFLAALPKAPVLFHPLRSPDRAVARRDFVLSEMATMGAITAEEAAAARAAPLVVRDPLGVCATPDQ